MKRNRVKHILVAIKALPGAQPALEFTSMLANPLKPQVTLLTVVTRTAERPAAERMLEDARRFFSYLEVETKVCIGKDAPKMILSELARSKVDLLVLGPESTQTLATLFFGSTSQYVVKHADCPVLVVRSKCAELRRVLICTGGQKYSRPVVRLGALLAQAVDASVTLLHITTPVPSMYTGLDEIEETLIELLQADTPLAKHLRWCVETLNERGISAEIQLRHGVVIDEILREATKGDFDMVVVGSHTAVPRWQTLMTDDVSRQLVNSSPCPVLVV